VQPPRRKTIRLPEYDYAQPGTYFVTVCVADRACLFGTIADGRMTPNQLGSTVIESWNDLLVRFRVVDLDAFIVMPNHVHGLIEICAPMARGLPAVVAAFKSISARRINAVRGSEGPLWQRGFYEHVVRNESDRDRIRTYIDENPMKWDLDAENPERRNRR
jgi:REP element-mobilizing transposase RayT